MKLQKILLTLIFFALVAGLGFAAVLTGPYWYPYLFPERAAAGEEEHDHHDEADRIVLSEPARKNIGLKMQAVELQSYQSVTRIPGMVAPRPGKTSITVTTPISGVVEKIAAYPGQGVNADADLFTLHLHYHDIHKIQADLYRTGQELSINEKEQKRLKQLVTGGTVAQKDLLQLEYEQARLKATLHSLQAHLLSHHFSKEQVQQIIDKGKFISEWTIRAPRVEALANGITLVETSGSDPYQAEANNAPLFEMNKLLVKPGDHVEAGQALCELANFQSLFIEARVFQPEIPLIEELIQKESAVSVEILDLGEKHWSRLEKPLSILYLDPLIDSASQTAGVFLELPNQHLEYRKNGKTYRLWKYRPGQKVYLTIPDRLFENVFILPREAVAQEGPETYVFSERGDALILTPVHVLFQDHRYAVIANDGSIFPRDVIAQNAADQLLRAIKTSGDSGHDHDHHHH